MDVNRKKRSNFSSKDACILVEIYEKYHAVIIGKHRGPMRTQDAKRKAWYDLTSEFHAQAVDQRRTLDQIQTKIENMKTKAREHARKQRYHETGGGPAPDSPPTWISKMFDIVHGATGDRLNGIGSGMDSSATVRIPSVDLSMESQNDNSVDASEVSDDENKWEVQHEMPKKKRRVLSESRPNSDLLNEQLAMVKENRILIAEQRKKVHLETYKLELEVLKIKQELRTMGIDPPSNGRFSEDTLVSDSLSLCS